jgi:group I intron endonuclease
MYIRSAGWSSILDIGIRLVQHLVINNSNEHLQNAITKYGLENFTFCVVEFYEVDPKVSQETNKANLLAMEQKYLDWLFSLSALLFISSAGADLRYNFNPTANSRLGSTQSEETRAQMSDSKSGILPVYLPSPHPLLFRGKRDSLPPRSFPTALLNSLPLPIPHFIIQG